MATRFDDWEGQFLQHHGIKGQKWGVRRYQNPDGTLTELGKQRQQKDFYKKLKETGKNTRYQDYKSRVNASLKLLPEDKIEKLNQLSKRSERRLERMTKGRDTEDEDYEKAYSEYYKERAQLVDDLLGKYGSKKVNGILFRESAKNNVTRLISAAMDKMREEDNAFSSFKKLMNSGKSLSDSIKSFNDIEPVYNHIFRNQRKLIDEWWGKKTSSWRAQQTSESFDAEAIRYAKKAARNMGLPANDETLYFLLDWFFNGDD